MKIDLESKEIVLLLGMMETVDPTGFFAGSVYRKLGETIKEDKMLQEQGLKEKAVEKALKQINKDK